MYPSLLDFLSHIEHECAFILQISRGKMRNEIENDELLSKGIIRSLEIIGEATKKLPNELRRSYPQVIGKKWLV